MQVTGISLDTFAKLVESISLDNYGGNVTVHQDAHELSGNRFVARLKVLDSSEHGARRSWTGRRVPAACWHAYRDVLAAVFEENPQATVRTAMAVYRGRDGFESTYPATGCQNIGSAFQPAYMPELCDCDE